MDFGKVLSNKGSSSDNKSEENIKEATETESSKDEKELDIDSSIRTDENIHNVVQPSNSQNEQESSSNDINDYEESSKPKAKKRKAKEVKYKQQIISQQSYISHIIELEKIFVPNPSPLIITVIGSEESGKTALLKKYIKKEFVYAHTPTESISIFEGKNYFNKGKKVPLCFVDTPPIHHQNNFLIVQDQILKSHIIIYMLDISEEDPLFTLHLSLLNIQFYKKQIIAVIGNKEDKIPSNEIIKRGIKEYCSFKGYLCSFYSCLKYKHDSVKHLIDKKIIKKYFDMYN
jgi:hypothetical protein